MVLRERKTEVFLTKTREGTILDLVSYQDLKGESFMKKLLALLLAVVMVLSLAACSSDDNDKDEAKGSQKNTYETPLELMMEQANEKSASKMAEDRYKVLNGLCEKEFKSVLTVLKKYNNYAPMVENFEEQIADQLDKYGENYKYSYKIEEKVKMDEEGLNNLEEEFENYAEQLHEYLYGLIDTNADPEDLRFDKDLIAALENVYKELVDVKVEEGYELTVTVTLKGSELDEPKEEEMTVCVYKVNGRWISEEAINWLWYINYILSN